MTPDPPTQGEREPERHPATIGRYEARGELGRGRQTLAGRGSNKWSSTDMPAPPTSESEGKGARPAASHAAQPSSSALGSCCCWASWLLSHRNVQGVLEAAHWSRHTQEVMAQVRGVFGLMTETGARGFELTGDERFLEPYDQARADLVRQLATLRSLTADNNNQQQRLDRLGALLEQQLYSGAETI